MYTAIFLVQLLIYLARGMKNQEMCSKKMNVTDKSLLIWGRNNQSRQEILKQCNSFPETIILMRSKRRCHFIFVQHHRMASCGRKIYRITYYRNIEDLDNFMF